MFYNPGGIETIIPPRFLDDPARRLRHVNYQIPLRHCGIHYWLENEKGNARTVATASSTDESYSLYVRASCNGFLTVWDIVGGKELTPRTYARWSGLDLVDGIFKVPGLFRFSREQPQRIIVVWARAQSEVARDAADAPRRLKEMPKWMPIVSESEETAAGEVGTYVVNRTDAGVPAEIVFQRR